MNFLFWLWTLDALDDIREQIRWNGLTPAQQAEELRRKKLKIAREKFITKILWYVVLALAVVGITLAQLSHIHDLP